MNDKELLELAAKAVGITIKYNYLGTQAARCPWNPLEDDGDALRLAVAIAFAYGTGLAMFFADADDPTVVVRKYNNTPGSMELVGDDPCAATRRAIVIAAAEIGKGVVTPNAI